MRTRPADGSAGVEAAPEFTPPDNFEVELKLAADRKALAALATSEPLLSRAVGHGVEQRLRYAYFDTANFDLRARGLALRVRQEGPRYVQTLKSGDGPAGGLQRRGEWQVEVPKFALDLTAFVDPHARAWLDGIDADSLKRVFTGTVRRKKQVLNSQDPDGVVEICFDEGEIRTTRGKSPICEVELELLRGGPGALFDLALDLHAVSPLRVETLSKSARGYLLATGTPPPCRKSDKPALRRSATVEQALEQTLRSCLDHWTANEAAVLDGRDPEGVHQMRVGLRRFRSVLALFRDVITPGDFGAFNDDARWAAQGLGNARDWDVFVNTTLPPVIDHRGDDAGLQALKALAEANVADGYDQARAVITAPRYTTFLLKLCAWMETRGWRAEETAAATLDQPLERFAGALLSKRHKRAMRLGKGFEHLSMPDRHRLRIAVKKLRYATEFFRGLYPKRRSRAYLMALEALQEDLGALNDVAVAEELLSALTVRKPRKAATELERAAGLVIGWYGHQLTASERRMVEDWHTFAATPPFWTAGGQ